MSTSYSIFRFAKPTKHELQDIKYFSPYNRHEIHREEDDDEDYESKEFIRLFRTDDEYAENLLKTKFFTSLILPRIETDHEKMFRSMGFAEEDIKNDNIHLTFGSGWYYSYTDGKEKRKIYTEEMKKFDYEVPTGCVAVKMEKLWDSSDVYAYPDHDLVKKYIPDIDKYYYTPINNSILAKAEIPFLIFERNKGRCFIEKG